MRIIFFGLMLVGFLILALIFVIIAMRVEEKKEQKRRMKAFHCKFAIRNGQCSKDCENCEWGGYED